MATQIAPDYPLLTAAEFREFDFGDLKAELDNGIIRMMAGGSARHAEVAGNIHAFLRTALRGSGCKPYSADMATRTHDLSVRYPDVSVFCGKSDPANDTAKSFDDPRVLFEVHSGSTARTDLRTKLDEYKALDSVDTIVFVDIASERLRVIQRTGPHGWSDVAHDAPFDVPLPALSLTLPHAEIFARD
ncbi:Uma2 family endonuclease [uncultured Sphingomonas sp.]|uniref:Uma2 family endonuclease n=1 Tax=uncultured Sphingomonas sp. TaxID=158754 RepID=UPI0025E795FF|nr:Uma2 family endonuclease [uncultured Sphingomonas sp.]